MKCEGTCDAEYRKTHIIPVGGVPEEEMGIAEIVAKKSVRLRSGLVVTQYACPICETEYLVKRNRHGGIEATTFDVGLVIIGMVAFQEAVEVPLVDLLGLPDEGYMFSRKDLQFLSDR